MLHTFFKTRILRESFVALMLASSVCVSGQSATAKAGSVLSDVQARALMQALAAQQNGGPALTAQQNQFLLQYLLAKNGSSSTAGSMVSAAQTQMMVQSLSTQAHGVTGNGLMNGAQTRGQASPLSVANAVAPATAAPAAPGEKKAGIVRIGIAMPKAQFGQAQGPSAGEPLRVMLMQYLTGPSVESTPIAALLPDQIAAEARAKQCDYIVYSTLSQKKPSGGLGFLKSSSMLNVIPGVGLASSMGKVMGATSAATAASQAASLSSSVKAKTDVVLEYHMNAMGNDSPLLANTFDTKATADGEDVITPMVEKAATAIMSQVSQNK
ncbi:MAG TPA: hypothetical protein VGU25_10510 [Acidobacteriaceae bacterium]|nr:hypothetical protein [Acidobacteriaceae bacterium]